MISKIYGELRTELFYALLEYYKNSCLGVDARDIELDRWWLEWGEYGFDYLEKLLESSEGWNKGYLKEIKNLDKEERKRIGKYMKSEILCSGRRDEKEKVLKRMGV